MTLHALGDIGNKPNCPVRHDKLITSPIVYISANNTNSACMEMSSVSLSWYNIRVVAPSGMTQHIDHVARGTFYSVRTLTQLITDTEQPNS